MKHVMGRERKKEKHRLRLRRRKVVERKEKEIKKLRPCRRREEK
jgi:hypothetical protein